MFYRLAFLLFVASVSANACPEVQTVDNFNITSYGQGIWYEVARYTNSGENIGECGSAEYELEGNEIKVKNFHVINNKAIYVEGVAKLAADAGKAGKVVLSLPHEGIGISSSALYSVPLLGTGLPQYDQYDDQAIVHIAGLVRVGGLHMSYENLLAGGVLTDSVLNILAIDYNRYLIAYSCKIDKTSQRQMESAWILSRSKVLSDESKTAVDKYLKESKILAADKFVWPKFNEEACKVDA